MTLTVTCPHCERVGKAPEETVGQLVVCPDCEGKFRVKAAARPFRVSRTLVVIGVVLLLLVVTIWLSRTLFQEARDIEKHNEELNKSLYER
jgi:uncharacterized paraquat-inducible protein A